MASNVEYLQTFVLTIDDSDLEMSELSNISKLRQLRNLTIMMNTTLSSTIDGVLVSISSGCKHLEKVFLRRELQVFCTRDFSLLYT